MTIPQFTAGQVLTAAELNAMVDAINAGGGKMEVQQFTVDGVFTVPAGVTFATAHIRAGGGGIGEASAGAGGTSSVDFAGGLVSATGGGAVNTAIFNSSHASTAGPANSGNGAIITAINNFATTGPLSAQAQDGAEIVAGAAVTPAATIAVVVGAGGTLGTNGAAGGSGYVWIEYVV